MPASGLNLFVFASSLRSCYWNGAATYYRGLYRELHALGHRVTFAEPDILDRQRHRDEDDYGYADVRVYASRRELEDLLRQAARADLIVKHSGIGAEDDFLAAAVLEAAATAGRRHPQTAYWDVDAPATLAEIEADAGHVLRPLLPQYDYVFTYGGGFPVVRRFLELGARNCYPIYNAFDPRVHFPVAAEAAWRADLAFVGHRLPDREERVKEFLLGAADRVPEKSFLLAGAGWEGCRWPANLRYAGHAPSRLHNAINSSAAMVLNVNRASMAAAGFSPPTRIFEAAGAGACVVTDAWAGIDLFFEPGREILVACDGAAVADCVASVDPERRRTIGARMRARALADHTYAQRAARVDQILRGPVATASPLAA